MEKPGQPGSRRRRFYVNLGNSYSRPRTDAEVQAAIKGGERPENARRAKFHPLRAVEGVDSAVAVDWLTGHMGKDKNGTPRPGYLTRGCKLRRNNLTGKVEIIYTFEEALAPPVTSSDMPEMSVAGGDPGVSVFMTLLRSDGAMRELGVGMPKLLTDFSAQHEFLKNKVAMASKRLRAAKAAGANKHNLRRLNLRLGRLQRRVGELPQVHSRSFSRRARPPASTRAPRSRPRHANPPSNALAPSRTCTTG